MRAIIQHLRFPFSILLMPVFLFSLSELSPVIREEHSINLWLLFIILHLLVYPSSNAFNSLQDRDEESIGLVKKPLPVPKSMTWITIGFDMLALLLSLFVSASVTVGISLYILFSRLYSSRSIRLKKYPILGFLTVFIFQGAVTYCLVQLAGSVEWHNINMKYAFVASCLIGAVYPLSQIYQHQQDFRDGVITLSYRLGYMGTFLFAGVMFALGTSIFLWQKIQLQAWNIIGVYVVCQAPTLIFFTYWFLLVKKNTAEANFKNTMWLNIISAISMIICFTCILFFVN
jgi:1,4-dihydroxy-2-naphthoate polyprenyltransferase